jgi:hypothetical protein
VLYNFSEAVSMRLIKSLVVWQIMGQFVWYRKVRNPVPEPEAATAIRELESEKEKEPV